MLQAVQTLHNWSMLYPGAYFGCVIIVLCIICCGWFKLGSMRLATAGAAPARPRFTVGWRFSPFSHTVLCQLANVAIMAKLESGIDYAGASLAVRIQI